MPALQLEAQNNSPSCSWLTITILGQGGFAGRLLYPLRLHQRLVKRNSMTSTGACFEQPGIFKNSSAWQVCLAGFTGIPRPGISTSYSQIQTGGERSTCDQSSLKKF